MGLAKFVIGKAGCQHAVMPRSERISSDLHNLRHAGLLRAGSHCLVHALAWLQAAVPSIGIIVCVKSVKLLLTKQQARSHCMHAA